MVFWLTLLGLVHHLPWLPGPPCWVGAPLAVAFWPTLPAMCTTCHVFLAHPARQVHHLPWFFLGPPCPAGAPLVVFWPTLPDQCTTYHLPWLSWPTLPGRCTTCGGFMAYPAGLVHHLPWFSDLPCWASAPLAAVLTWPTLPGRCTTCRGFYLTHPAGLVHHLP